MDVITHAPLNRDLNAHEAAALAARGAVLVPTLTMMRGVSEAVGRKLMFRLLRLLRVAPPVEYAHARNSVAAAHEAGLTILAGTDANNEAGAPLSSPARQLLARRTGTAGRRRSHPGRSNSVRHRVAGQDLGLNDRGAVAAGLRADLMLVDGEPTVDIAAIRNVRGVWIDGARVLG